MLTRVCIYVALLIAAPIFPQAISPVNPAPAQNNDQMATPPPVSGVAYPTALGADVRSNYLRGGMTLVTAYIDNIYPGNGSPTAETTFSILPSIDFDQTTPIRHAAITFSPGFTFYQPSSQLNEVDENASLAYQVQLTPHSSIRVNDGFRYSSTSFSSVASEIGGAVSGSAQPITPGIIAPFAKQLTNIADGEFVLQMSRSSMIGASGTATTLHYPNPSEVTGLYDSSSHGGSGFYNRRISESQYLGATFNYTDVFAYPPNAESDTQLQGISGFYTIYPRQKLSLSVSGGPQNYQVKETGLSTFSAWDPSISTSIGWQGLHTSLAASYSQSVTGGGGLVGAFHSKNANATVRWQISRAWVIGAGADYAISRTVSPLIFTGVPNVRSVSASSTVTRAINQQLNLTFEYDRLHESYGVIATRPSSPDSDRATVSVSWQFTRPLGQ